MQTRRLHIVMMAVLVTSSLWAQTLAPPRRGEHSDARVTPVTGESWLVHLSRSFGDTSMGKTVRLGPGPQEKVDIGSMPMVHAAPSRETVTLHGADLYRLNCQGCHGETGLGAPPEINSVINPVRATSVPLIRERMKNAGMDVGYADTLKMAQQARAALLERLHKGGENMPAFPQLSDAEVRLLLAYLKQLAQIPGAGREQGSVSESHVRVGELIVKSTCHTCHSAVGADPTPAQLMDGAIPPLSTLVARKDQSEFVRKVTQGEPVWMGTPAEMHRGRMPVLFYVTDEEAADAYLYLSQYPPDSDTTSSPLLAASLSGLPNGKGPGPPAPPAAIDRTSSKETGTADPNEFEMSALPSLAALVMVVLAGGVYFTFREFKRLTSQSARRNVRPPNVHVESGIARHLRAIDAAARPQLYGGAKQGSQ